MSNGSPTGDDAAPELRVRIGLQLLSLQPGTIGGVEGYVRRVLRAMIPQLGVERLVLFLRPAAAATETWRSLSGDARVETVTRDPTPHYGEGYERWNLELLAAARLDAVFFPLSFFYPRPLPIPVAMHIGDIQHEYFPGNFSADQLAWRRARIPESVRLADAVITDSHFSAECMRERYGPDERRIHVVPLAGFDEREIRSQAAPTAPPECDGQPFILYPAGDWPHKNHATLLRALRVMAERGRPEHLVLTTMVTPERSELQRRIEQLGLADRVHSLGCVSTERLIGLYRSARLMAFPSLFEGFGLPLVEAMQLDCPVVASKAGAVVETAGGAALHCDDDAQAWADAMIRIADGAAERQELIATGRRRSTDFGWDRCAAQHLRILRDIARTRPKSEAFGQGGDHLDGRGGLPSSGAVGSGSILRADRGAR